MSFAKIDWNPQDRQLRQFAWIACIVLPLAGWIWGAPTGVLTGLAIAGAILLVASCAVPAAVRPIFLALSIISFPIGVVVGEVVMIVIYFAVFLPIGTIFRLMRRDALERRIDKSATTYWQPKKQPGSVDRYFRQW